MKQIKFSIRADILAAITAFIITKDLMMARLWFAALNIR